MSVMKRMAVTAAIFAVAAAPAHAALPTLHVTYAMNCTFTITDDAKQPVTSIAPGNYQVQVTTPVAFGGIDLSGTNDMTACKGFVQFHLTGPGVNVETTLMDGDAGFDLMPVTFQAGQTYTATDGNQPTVARVSFTTSSSGSAAPVPTSTTSPTSSKKTSTGGAGNSVLGTPLPTALRGTLVATVGHNGALTLTDRGLLVTSLKSGRYRVVVDDRSSIAGFTLQRLKQPAQTVSGATFVGKKTATISFGAGQWFFYPAGTSGKKTYFIVIA